MCILSKKVNNEDLLNVSGGAIEEVSTNGEPIGQGGVYEGKYNIFDEDPSLVQEGTNRMMPIISVEYHDAASREEALQYAYRIDEMLNGHNGH